MSPNLIVKNTRQIIGKVITKMIPPGWGFSLFVFPFDDREGDLTYISTAQREDFLTMLKNFIKHSEASPEDFGKDVSDDQSKKV